MLPLHIGIWDVHGGHTNFLTKSTPDLSSFLYNKISAKLAKNGLVMTKKRMPTPHIYGGVDWKFSQILGQVAIFWDRTTFI